MIWRRRSPSTPVEDKPKGFDDYDLRLGDLMRGERATLGKSLLDVQRELKIKATYIAAIENADISAFATPGFVAGYVRSYARYLGMDPDAAYRQFCAEANFTAIPQSLGSAAAPRSQPVRPSGLDALGHPDAVFVPRGPGWTQRIEPGAIGSIAVLVLLIAGIGYGGWSVLREVQRVQVAPIEQAPLVAAAIDPLGNISNHDDDDGAVPGSTPFSVDTALARAAPTAEALGQLQRPQALAAPQLIARDGPIAAIPAERQAATADPAVIADGGVTTAPVRVLAEAAPPVEILAVQPAWVRVRAADGTVLFEKILDAGESYTVPQAEAPATLRAGNSGAVYFMVNGQAHGPAASGAQVVNNVALSPEALNEKFTLVDLTTQPDVARFVELAQSRWGGESPTE